MVMVNKIMHYHTSLSRLLLSSTLGAIWSVIAICIPDEYRLFVNWCTYLIITGLMLMIRLYCQYYRPRPAYCYGRFGEKRVDAERDQPSVGQSDEPKRESSGCERGTKIYFDYGGWRRKLYSTGHLSDYRRGRCHRHRYSDDKG